MAQEREKLIAFKNRCKDLEIKMEKYESVIEDYKRNEDKADEKMNALNKIHGDKVRALMNSISLLKKENKELEKLQNESNRSKLIEQLQKDIQEQDIVIAALRKFVTKTEEQDKVDGEIVKELNKGPPKIKAPSREEMKMSIKKLESQIALGGSGGGNKSALNKSQNNSQQISKQEESKLNDSRMSQESTTAADSTENLIRRLEDLKNEIDELKLNLKASQEIIDRYEEEMEIKGQELNELRGAKTDFMYVTRKHEILQKEFEKYKSTEHDKYINHYDKELRVEELEITTKNLKLQLKTQGDRLRQQVNQLSSKCDEQKAKLDELTWANNKLTKSNEEAFAKLNQYEKDSNNNSNKTTQLEAELKEKQLLFTTEIELANTNIIDLEFQLSEQERQLLQMRNDLNTKSERIDDVQRELEQYKMKGYAGGFDNTSMAQSFMGGTGIMGDANVKDMRQKVKYLTKREIELQDKIEQLSQELAFKEQREKAINFMNKKSVQSTIGQEELKRKYQKEIQERYESKIGQLYEKVKDLTARNLQLQDIHKRLEDAAENLNFHESLSISNVSLSKLDNIQVDDNSSIDMNEMKNKIVKDDQEDLQKQLLLKSKKELELKNKIDELQIKLDEKSIPSRDDKKFDQKIDDMQHEYKKVIKDLSKKVSDLQFKEVQLSRMDSNIASILGDSDKHLDSQDLNEVDSNISFGQEEIMKKERKYSQISSNLGEVIKDDDMEGEDIRSMDSGISEELKMVGKKKKK